MVEGRESTLRVLQYTYGGVHVSGIDSYLLDVFRAVDGGVATFDFLFRYSVPYTAEVVAEIQGLGSDLKALGVPEDASVWRKQALEIGRLFKAFRSEAPAAVEVNMTSTFMCIVSLGFARLAGVKVRIAHAQDAVPTERGMKRLLKKAATPLLNRLATDRWACSEAAAEYLFGPRVVDSGQWSLLRNTVDAESFAFDRAKRDATRDALGVTPDQLCIGIVGRFTPQKNHARALRVLKTVLTVRKDAVLVVVGDGPLLDAFNYDARELGIPPEALRVLGLRRDLQELYCAFDVMIAPSLHEGFPITALGAQACGLPMVVSDAFPIESNISGQVQRLSLTEGDETWGRALLEADRKDRSGGVETIIDAGYDKRTVGPHLDAAYRSALAILGDGVPS